MAVIFRRQAVFRFWAVMTLAEAVKQKNGGNFWAVMPYGGKFSAVSGCSFISFEVARFKRQSQY